MSPQAFIFIGRSGGGKGTQASLLIKTLKEKDPSHDTLYLQTGLEFREFIKGDTYTQKRSAEYYKNDKLQPDFLAVKMWVDPLALKYKENDHIIFDGTPRRNVEAETLDSVFDSTISFYNFAKPHVIYLDVSPEESLKRLLKRKRLDDSEESIKKRLAWYEDMVAPTVEWYRNNPKYFFHEINGQGSVYDVHAEIVKKVGLV